MTGRGPDARVTGWLLAGTAAAALLSGAAALALAADRPVPVVTLDLGLLPPASPALTALAAPPPPAPTLPPLPPETPTPEDAAPDVPATDQAPDRSTATAMPVPEPEAPVVAEMHLPEPKVKPKPKPIEATRETKAEPRSEEAPKKPRKVAEAAPEDAAAGSPAAASKPKVAGGLSPAAYAKAVMKKVRSTRKAARGGKGTAVVGFSIGADGSLAAVTLLQSSGDAALDGVALDHIRRAAPFPTPPPDAGRNYSFEFVGK